EFDQALHRSLVNGRLIVADEIADDRKPLVRVSAENSVPIRQSIKNAMSEIQAKTCERLHRDIVHHYYALRGVSPRARFILRFGGPFDFTLPKIAERRVGEERNEPFFLSAPFGIHQTRQGFQPRGPDRLTILYDRLQKRAIAFSPGRIALSRGVFAKQGQSDRRHERFSG